MGQYSQGKETNAEAWAEAFVGIVLTQALDSHKALQQAYPKLPKVSNKQWTVSFVAAALFTALLALDLWGAPEVVKQKLGVIFVNLKNQLPEAMAEYDKYKILYQQYLARLPSLERKPDEQQLGSEALGDLLFQSAYKRQAEDKDEYAVKMTVGLLMHQVYGNFWENGLQDYLNFKK